MNKSRRRAYVDANVILRWLLGEPEPQALAAQRLFDRAAEGQVTLMIHSTVLAEVIYVLTSPRLGGHARDRVSNVLRDLLGLEGVEMVDLDVTLRALRAFEQTHLDWVDCLLLAYGPDAPVYTFDQDMVRLGGIIPPGAV